MNRLNFSKIISSSILAACILFFAGCSKNQDTSITELSLGYWGSADDEAADECAVSGIDSVIPGIKIKLIQYPSDTEFWDNLPSQIAAGTAPDIVVITNERYLEYIDNGLIQSLDPSKLDLSNVSKDTINIWTRNGKMYGMPVESAPACFLINMDLWKEAGLSEDKLPQTWADVETAAKRLTKNGVYGLIFNPAEFHITQYVQSFKGGWNEGKTIASEQNAAALDFIIKMFKENLAVTPKQLGESWDGAVFTSGKGAMTTGGFWYAGAVASGAPSMHYKAIPVPQISADNGYSYSLHSTAFVVLNNSKHKNIEMEKILNYMGREEYEQFTMKRTGALPSNLKVSDEYFEIHPQFQSLQKFNGVANSFGYPEDTQRFTNKLITGIESAIYTKNSNITGTDILKKVENEMKSE